MQHIGISGGSPIACGEHRTPIADEVAVQLSVQCVTDAAKQGRPAWMVVYRTDGDTWVGKGVFSRDGFVRRFDYDSAGPLGDGRAPLGLSECASASPKIKLEDRGSKFFTVDCSARPKSN